MHTKQTVTLPKVIMGSVELISGGAATVGSSQNTNNNSNIFDGIDGNQTQFVSGDIGGGYYYSQITLDLTSPLDVGDYSVVELANVDVTTPARDNGAIQLHLRNENGDNIVSVDFSNQPDATGQDLSLYIGGYAQPIHSLKIEQGLYDAHHSALRIGEVKLRPNPVSSLSSQGFVYEVRDLETLTAFKYVAGDSEYILASGDELIEWQINQLGASTSTTVSGGGDTINISGSTCSSGIFTTAPSGLSLYAIVGDCDTSGGDLLNTSGWVFDGDYTEGTREEYVVNLTNVGQSPLSGSSNYNYQFVDSRLCTTDGPANRCFAIFLYPSGETTPSGNDVRLGGGSL